MTVEVSVAISLVSLIVAIIVGVSGMKRTARNDDKKDASELTTVIVKLENIGSI